jgi:HD-GYP domain-containing protein (c-di-GMP phosphodiesterase class II)
VDIFLINPVSLMQTMTMALDLAIDGVSLHQKRTAIICSNLSDKIGSKLSEEQNLLSAALMHDIGAASNTDERKKLLNPHLANDMGLQIFEHAENGYHLLKTADTFAEIAESVRYHHDNWSGGNPSGLSGAAIPLNARIIHLADRIEIQTNKTGSILNNVDPVVEFVKKGRNRQFDPDLVDTFLQCSEKESFWLDLTIPELANSFNDRMKLGWSPYSIDDLLQIAEIFATIIDRMSRFTATHSRSVSGVAVFLADCCGFSKSELNLIRIAGLLHDLGKLSIPNNILEKPGPLTKDEQLIVRQHTFYTYRILQLIDNLGNVAQWAAFHHETLDGRGYPFKVDENSLSLGSRVMAVADIFVALAENRPYRKKLPKETVQNIMLTMVENHKISGTLVELLFDHYAEADRVVQSMETWAGSFPLIASAN